MKQTVTFSSYLFKILIIAVLFIALPMAFSFGGQLPTTGSFLVSCVCFFILTIVSAWLILGKHYVRFYTITFVLQIIIGIIHYLSLVDPNYFLTNGDPVSSFWNEHQYVFRNVEQLINNRIEKGLFYFDNTEWEVSHSEIWKIISLPFTFLGHKWLNYAPLNTFSSLLASINIMFVYNTHYPNNDGDYKSARRWLLMVSAYFPLFILNDTLWRDPFGMALISIGIVFLMISNTKLTKILSVIILSLFAFIQRTVYVIIIGATYAINEIRRQKNGFVILLLPLFVIILFVLSRYVMSFESEEYASGYVNQMSLLALPIKIIFGLIGPFPWTQFGKTFNGMVNYAYQLRDYLLGILQLGFLLAIINKRKLLSLKNLDFMTLMGVGIMFSGFLTTMMHIGYIAEGVYFMLPWFLKKIGSDFGRYILVSFFILVFLNLIVSLFGISGISTMWR